MLSTIRGDNITSSLVVGSGISEEDQVPGVLHFGDSDGFLKKDWRSRGLGIGFEGVVGLVVIDGKSRESVVIGVHLLVG